MKITGNMIDGALELLFQILTLVVFAVVIMMLFRNFDSKSLLDNFKFEIKKAKDMHQRLDDVKGVDEIKEEIHNLI
jgi:ATP-dependent Zn protease